MDFQFLIPNYFYDPSGNNRLLSPQHWAQASRYPHHRITNCSMITLVWVNNEDYLKAVTLGMGGNVATFRTSPGYQCYHTLCIEAKVYN